VHFSGGRPLTPARFLFDAYAVPLFLAGFFLVLLSIFHFFKKKRLDVAWGFLCLCVAVSYGGAAFNLFDRHPQSQSGWYLFGVCLIPAAFHFFTVTFLRLTSKMHQAAVKIISGVSLLFGIASQWSIGFVTGPGQHVCRYGWMGRLFIIYFLAVSLLCLTLWYLGFWRESDRMHRRRIQILFIGFSLMHLGLIDFLPACGLPLYPAGCLAVLVLITFQSYFIHAYDVTLVQSFLSGALSRAAVLLLIAVPWATGLILIEPLFHRLPGYAHWLLNLILFGLSVPYIFLGIPLATKFLLKKETEYQKVIEIFLEQIIHLKNPNKLVQYIYTLMKNTMDCTNVKIIIKSIEHHSYHLWKNDYSRETVHPSFEPFLPWLEQNPGILLCYDVGNNPDFEDVRNIALPFFEALNAQILVPLVQSDSLLGVIGIGHKNNGEMLEPLEMYFLRRLQTIASMALNNSYLYEYIRQLSRDLWEVNVNLNGKVTEKTQELENALTVMKKLNEEQREFFTMASHTLRTPLTSIKLATTLLWNNHPEPQQAMIHGILQNNIRRLEALISDILEIVKAENGKLELSYSDVHIQQVIMESQQEMQWLHSDKYLIWRFHLQSGLDNIRADANRLKTVFVNLFSNAYKFTANNGEVNVSLKIAETDDLAKYSGLEKLANRVYYEFSVWDNGEGIPEDEKQAIFEIFRQVSRSHKRYQGNGLGLSLLKKSFKTTVEPLRWRATWARGPVSHLCFLPKTSPGERSF
jgi:signal transduction histidine kinase